MSRFYDDDGFILEDTQDIQNAEPDIPEPEAKIPDAEPDDIFASRKTADDFSGFDVRPGGSEIPLYKEEDDEDYDEDDEESEGFFSGLIGDLLDFSGPGMIFNGFLIFLLFTYLNGMLIRFLVRAFTFEGKAFSVNPLKIFGFLVDKPAVLILCMILALLLTIAVMFFAKKIDDRGGDRSDLFKGRNKTSGMYGSAHFATNSEFAEKTGVEYGSLSHPKPVVIGKAISGFSDSVGRSIYLRKLFHMLVYAPTRRGKTVGIAYPNILAVIDANKNGEPCSAIINDPSGEMFQKVYKLASKFMNVKIINFNNLSSSDGWDPLASIKNAKTTSQRLDLIEKLCHNVIYSDPATKKDNFAGQIKNLFAFLVTYVSISPNFLGREDERTLGTCFNILTEIEAGNPDLLAHFEELPIEDESRALWKGFSSASPNQKAGYLSGLHSRIQILNDDMVKEVLSHDEISFRTLSEKPTLYFVSSPYSGSSYTWLLSLFFTMAFSERMSPENIGNPIPLYCIFDEVTSVGSIGDFENVISNIGKYNGYIIAITQSPNKLEEVYGPNLRRSIEANCKIKIYMGAGDIVTAQEISKTADQATINNTTTRHDRSIFNPFYIPVTENVSSTEGKAMVITPNDARTLPMDEMYIFADGADAYKAKIYYWYQYHYMKDYLNDPAYNISINDYIPKWQAEGTFNFDEKGKSTFLGYGDPAVISRRTIGRGGNSPQEKPVRAAVSADEKRTPEPEGKPQQQKRKPSPNVIASDRTSNRLSFSDLDLGIGEEEEEKEPPKEPDVYFDESEFEPADSDDFSLDITADDILL